MSNGQPLITKSVFKCQQNGCSTQFIISSTKLKNHQILCKKHRNLCYKRKHMQKKKQLANQFMESKKVLYGTEALIGQPLSSFLDQVLIQKRLALMKSPDVIQHLKEKQKEVENKSKGAMNFQQTTTTETLKSLLSNQAKELSSYQFSTKTLPTRLETKQSTPNTKSICNFIKTSQVPNKGTQKCGEMDDNLHKKQFVEPENRVNEKQMLNNKPLNSSNIKSLSVPLQELNNLDFLDTNVNFEMTLDDGFYENCFSGDMIKQFNEPVTVPYQY